ncbi:MAG: hypothetical protein B7Y84_16725 [Azorhizobium sp. 32-67-21]|nr:MAG: hypothetical protein B7Y84_16725 [Azorhizobium sp. 32-67-21]
MVRPLSTMDEAQPNYQAVAADALVRLAALTGREALRERADRILTALSGTAAQNAIAHGALLNAIGTRLSLAEIAVVNDADGRFRDAALALPFLDRTVIPADEAGALPEGSLAGARQATAPADGAAFVCRAGQCSAPVTDPAELAALWLK